MKPLNVQHQVINQYLIYAILILKKLKISLGFVNKKRISFKCSKIFLLITLFSINNLTLFFFANLFNLTNLFRKISSAFCLLKILIIFKFFTKFFWLRINSKTSVKTIKLCSYFFRSNNIFFTRSILALLITLS